MEEKEKKSNFSPNKNKPKDLIKKEKDQKENSASQKNCMQLPDKYYKFDITYKNKELNKFKDEILSYLRNRDYYYIEKIKNIKSQADINDQNLDNLSEVMQNNFNSILSAQAEINSKLDKLKSYDAFVNKANDKLISHEIRLNCLREDLTKTTQKYDKIYLENLEVPGYIGRCSKYPNCKIFFTEIIKEMDKLNTFREKNIIDLCTYKERLENIIKMFQNLVDNNNDSQIKYITKLNDRTNKNLLETLEEKIGNVRVDNSRFAIDLINKTSELNDLYNKMCSMRDYIIKEFNNKSNEYNKKVEETKQSFYNFKIEYEIIRKKFLELADFIKSGRFSRNFGSIFGKKEINAINKKLVKDKKESIDSKDVKLMDNIEDIEKLEFNRNKADKENKNSNLNNINITNNVNSNINRMSKSQNNFFVNNNIGKRKNFGFVSNVTMTTNNSNNTNSVNSEKNRYSVDTTNNQMKVHHGVLFYLGENNTTKNNQQKNNINKNNLINEKDKKVKNSIIPIEKPEKSKNQIQKIKNENKEKEKEKEKNKNNSDLVDIKIEKIQNEEKTQKKEEKSKKEEKLEENKEKKEEKKDVKKEEKEEKPEKKEEKEEKVEKEEKRNTFTDELSMSESFISNINNSINTFSTTNDKNNSLNSLISLNNNNNKCNKFNLFEEDLQHKDKVIKELASELEQSTAKVNKLASNKKDIEENFKNICNKIQPMNLKLNNLPLEQIPEQNINNKLEKDKDNMTNKSEQNTTIISHNINNNLNNTNINVNNTTHTNINNENLNKTRNNKLKYLIESKEKNEENNTTIKSNKSKNTTKHNNNTQNNLNETLLNDTINFSIDKKMNIYDKKIGDLETFTREQIIEIIKQINILKKTYTYISNILKRDKNSSSYKSNGYNSGHNNIFDQPDGGGNSNNNNFINNENRNSLNLTGNNFHKKYLKNEISSKFGGNKIIQTMDDINFRDNLFYNGKYYFNIKDIFDKNKNSINFNIDNKKFLKQIDNKFFEENSIRNRSNSSHHKNGNLKSNNIASGGNNESKLAELKNQGKGYKRAQKPQSGISPCSLIISGEK